MPQKNRVTVLGDGGWGTALAIVNARHGNDVLLWSAFPGYAKILKEKRENSKFLPAISFPESMKITDDLGEALKFGDIIVFAIPTQYLRNILFKIKDLPYKDKIFVSVAKGIEKKTCMRSSEIIHAILPGKIPIVVITGPSHAEEVARNIPTLVVAASKDAKAAKKVQDVFKDPCFRVYVQTDMVGAEIGGALKNVIAIAAGVCDGLEFGDNTKSGMITRGLLEMMRVGVKCGANPNTFFGLSGLGDLVTTCFSKHGRNLYVGRQLGKGKKIKEILANMDMVAEGVSTAESAYELCTKTKVSFPIIDQVYQIIYKNKDPKQAVSDLLSRAVYEELKYF